MAFQPGLITTADTIPLTAGAARATIGGTRLGITGCRFIRRSFTIRPIKPWTLTANPIMLPVVFLGAISSSAFWSSSLSFGCWRRYLAVVLVGEDACGT